MMSVVAAPAVAGRPRRSAARARCDCGLLIGLPPLISAPGSSEPIATAATTATTVQPTIVRHGLRAAASAKARVESLVFMSIPFLKSNAPALRRTQQEP